MKRKLALAALILLIVQSLTAARAGAQGLSHLERADVQFTVEVPVDTRIYINLAYRAHHVDGKARSFAFYDERGLVYSNCTSEDSPSDFYVTAIPLHKGTNCFAFTGEHLEFSLSSDSYVCSVLREFIIRSPKALLNLILCNLGMEGTLDFSGCTALRALDLDGNRLTGIRLAHCVGLEAVSLCRNRLSEIDLSDCHGLRIVELGGNLLTSLDLSHCSHLQYLYSSDNRLSEVNLSGCAELKTLYLDDNRLREVDLSDCSGLRSIDICRNRLSSIDLSRCTKLLLLFLAGNGLSEIAFGRCDSLHLMDLKDNCLSELDLRQTGALLDLFVSGNRLKELDLSGCPLLESVDYGNNVLRSVKMPHSRVLIRDAGSNLMAFSQFTPGLYGWYVDVKNPEEQRTFQMKADEESLCKTGTWDFTAKLTANAEAGSTEFRFQKDGHDYVPQREGNVFRFEAGGSYSVWLTNPHYPLLRFFAGFSVPEPPGVDR